MSPMFKSTGSGSLRRKFGEEVVDRCKSNFDTIWGDTGLSYAKKKSCQYLQKASTRFLLPFEHNTRT